MYPYARRCWTDKRKRGTVSQQRRHMPGVDASRCPHGQFTLTKNLICSKELTDLFPTRCHQLFLMALDNLCAEGGRDPAHRIAIEFFEPRRANCSALGASQPAAVSGRTDTVQTIK